MRLANPSIWVEPTLEQAQADLAVGQRLLDTPINAPPYNGFPAADAAVAKLQQAAEKALKASILALASGSSDLVFYPHRLLMTANLPTGVRRFRDLMDRIARVKQKPGLRATLEELESYAPSGASDAETDESGLIVALPLNTEYPFLRRGAAPTAPATAWRDRAADVARFARAVRVLFRVLKGLPELAPYLQHYAAPPIR
jgi:hypothetical protein